MTSQKKQSVAVKREGCGLGYFFVKPVASMGRAWTKREAAQDKEIVENEIVEYIIVEREIVESKMVERNGS